MGISGANSWESNFSILDNCLDVKNDSKDFLFNDDSLADAPFSSYSRSKPEIVIN